jgi:hypothetical protein
MYLFVYNSNQLINKETFMPNSEFPTTPKLETSRPIREFIGEIVETIGAVVTAGSALLVNGQFKKPPQDR